ncbi:MAG: hypothetical protein IIB02_01265 [Thaumarchaeota archaeon]|nr:hypothetical protein [Nitrososphaerota archaeon]
MLFRTTYNYIENFDLIYDKEILIIEDSEISSIKITSILNKLGFKKIHVNHTAASGLYSFEKLIKSGKPPIIFLNFLPYTDILPIVNLIHQIYLDTKIILVSTYDNKSKKVQDMVSNGIYWNLQIPLSLDELSTVIKNIKTEEKLFDNNANEKIISYLQKHSTLVLEDLKTIVNDPLKLDEIISNMERDGLLIEKNEITQIICNNCQSSSIHATYCCTACQSPNFTQSDLIEHYRCGNISLERNYIDGKCQKCRKDIGCLGVDYKKTTNFFSCSKCNDTFSEPLLINNCTLCNVKFRIDEAIWQTSKTYAVVNYESHNL